MASRASSHRGEPAGIAAQSARARSRSGCSNGQLAEQPAGLVGGRVGGEVADLPLEGLGIRGDQRAGLVRGHGAAARQGAEHPGAGRGWARRPGRRRPRERGKSASANSARLEEERPGAEPVAGRGRGLAGRRGGVRGPGRGGARPSAGRRPSGRRRPGRPRRPAVRPRPARSRPRSSSSASRDSDAWLPLQRADLPEQLGCDAATGPAPSGGRASSARRTRTFHSPLTDASRCEASTACIASANCFWPICSGTLTVEDLALRGAGLALEGRVELPAGLARFPARSQRSARSRCQ